MKKIVIIKFIIVIYDSIPVIPSVSFDILFIINLTFVILHMLCRSEHLATHT